MRKMVNLFGKIEAISNSRVTLRIRGHWDTKDGRKIVTKRLVEKKRATLPCTTWSVTTQALENIGEEVWATSGHAKWQSFEPKEPSPVGA